MFELWIVLSLVVAVVGGVLTYKSGQWYAFAVIFVFLIFHMAHWPVAG